MLPAIKDALAAKSFDGVGADYGVTGQSVINFLNRHGVDHKQFKKVPGAPKRKTVGDDWPEPVKPAKKMSLVAEPKPAEMPKMKFRKKKVRDSWGNESERLVPINKYRDPETGAKVTTYPPGYAFNAHPQRSVHVKGGA